MTCSIHSELCPKYKYNTIQYKYTVWKEKYYLESANTLIFYKIVLPDKNQQTTRITGTHSHERSTNHGLMQYTTTRTVPVEDLHNGSSRAVLPTSMISPTSTISPNATISTLTDTEQKNYFPNKSKLRKSETLFCSIPFNYKSPSFYVCDI